MSVLWIRSDFPSRGGTFETPLKSKSKRHWKALVDSKTDDEHTIYAFGLQQGILPDYLDSHPNNILHRCRAVNINQESDTWKFWDITADYSSEPFDVTDEEEADTPPLDRSTKISWESVQYEKAVYKDRDDNAFLNSAGTPYAAQLIDDARLVINLRKNVSVVPSFLLDFMNVINNGTFTIQSIPFPEETLKTQGLRVSEERNEQDTTFYELSMQLHYRKEGWGLSLLDEGIYETGNVKITDDDGDAVREPVPLDGSGSELSSPTPATSVFNDFDVYTATDFSVLPF